MATAGYSGTPLAKKLGIKAGYTIVLINVPEHYLSLFSDMPDGVIVQQTTKEHVPFIHFFTTSIAELRSKLPLLKTMIKPDGMIWISWAKKSAKVAGDITENIVRDTALSIGLVDIKVCAVDETWSGLKLVIPVKDR